MSLEDLERRVAVLEHERALERLVAEYSRACDPIDPERVASLFTEDGRWSSRATDGSVDFGAVEGRDAIHDKFVELQAAIGVPTLHYNLQGRIELAEDHRSARATWYTIVLTRPISEAHPAGEPTLLQGTYVHEYRREEDGAWRFARVDTLIEFMASLAGLPGQLPDRQPPSVEVAS